MDATLFSECDWTILPNLVCFLILDKFMQSKDVVNFGFVCKQWYLASKNFIDRRRDLSHKTLPMLLIPTKRGRKKKNRKLYSVIEERFICSIHVRSNKKFCGSSYGWLAFNNENNIITLVNPFKNGSTIQLPQLHIPRRMRTIHYWFDVQKLILSADPALSPQSYIALVIFGGYATIAYTRSGQNSWIMIDNENMDRKLTLFVDAIFYRNIVYAVTNYGKVVSFDVCSNSKNTSQSPIVNVLEDPGINRSLSSQKAYLVESSKGELLLVRRYYDIEWIHTETFKVYKLLLDQQSANLVEKVELRSLGGDALFVGHNYSMSISDMDFLENQRNVIYFTNDFQENFYFAGDQDIGIFNMEDERIKTLYTYRPSQRCLPPVIWIVPPYRFDSNESSSS